MPGPRWGADVAGQHAMALIQGRLAPYDLGPGIRRDERGYKVSADDHSRPWETTRRGMLLLVSSPAGAGKTSLTRQLVADLSDLILSISATTRDPRPGEHEGREYFFKTRPEFEAMIAEGAFLEWATVNGNYYGTPK